MPDSSSTMLEESTDDDDEEEDPLLIVSMKCSYQRLVITLSEINFNTSKNAKRSAKRSRNGTPNTASTSDEDDEDRLQLPPELVLRIIGYLTVKCVDPNVVQAVGCSSHDKSHPLSCCLSEDETTWWISATGSMPGWRGHEYVEFDLTHQDAGESMCRLTTVSIKIPPLPQGPLSVGLFYLESLDINTMRCVPKTENDDKTKNEGPTITGDWKVITPTYVVENQTGWQRYTLEEAVDVRRVRIVCLANQMGRIAPNAAHNLEDHLIRQFSSVGFFSIRFE